MSVRLEKDWFILDREASELLDEYGDHAGFILANLTNAPADLRPQIQKALNGKHDDTDLDLPSKEELFTALYADLVNWEEVKSFAEEVGTEPLWFTVGLSTGEYTVNRNVRYPWELGMWYCQHCLAQAEQDRFFDEYEGDFYWLGMQVDRYSDHYHLAYGVAMITADTYPALKVFTV